MLAAPKLRAGPLAAVFFYVNLEITTDGAKREPAFQIDLNRTDVFGWAWEGQKGCDRL